MLAFRTGGELGQFSLRANRPPLQTATTIRADIMQYGLDTVGAEGALERANTGFLRIWW